MGDEPAFGLEFWMDDYCRCSRCGWDVKFTGEAHEQLKCKCGRCGAEVLVDPHSLQGRLLQAEYTADLCWKELEKLKARRKKR